MNAPDADRLMTCSQVAELLHLHPKTVERWARDGKLPCIRVARMIRFRSSDIASWAERRTVKCP